MREILFRGKTRYGAWVYGSLVQQNEFCCIMEEGGDWFDAPYLDPYLGIIDGQITPVVPETIGQYTGFTDIHGKKIFEDDIVKKRHQEDPSITTMCVQECRGSWRLWDCNENDDFLSNWCSGHYLHGREVGGCIVVGNYTDNPELLGGYDRDNHLQR